MGYTFHFMNSQTVCTEKCRKLFVFASNKKRGMFVFISRTQIGNIWPQLWKIHPHSKRA
jgi:hypothetical protein